VGEGTLASPYNPAPMPRGQACIELGNAFQSAKRYLLANNATLDFLLKTPANSHVIVTQLAVSSSAAPMELDLREDVIVSANGSALTLYNLNRQSADAPLCLLYQGPTVTDAGLALVEMELHGDKTYGGDGGRDCGMILKAGASYLLRIKNTSGGSATFSLDLRVSET
jgi:hypothetical protein